MTCGGSATGASGPALAYVAAISCVTSPPQNGGGQPATSGRRRCGAQSHRQADRQRRHEEHDYGSRQLRTAAPGELAPPHVQRLLPARCAMRRPVRPLASSRAVGDSPAGRALLQAPVPFASVRAAQRAHVHVAAARHGSGSLLPLYLPPDRYHPGMCFTCPSALHHWCSAVASCAGWWRVSGVQPATRSDRSAAPSA
jgi:hypothetical protein